VCSFAVLCMLIPKRAAGTFPNSEAMTLQESELVDRIHAARRHDTRLHADPADDDL